MRHVESVGGTYAARITSPLSEDGEDGVEVCAAGIGAGVPMDRSAFLDRISLWVGDREMDDAEPICIYRVSDNDEITCRFVLDGQFH